MTTATTDSGKNLPHTLIIRRLMRLLRFRVWIQEHLQPTEWQVTLIWAAVAGFLGSLAAILFAVLTENIYDWFGNRRLGIVGSIQQLPWWGCLLVPAAGGALAGLVLTFGQRLTRKQSSTDYMEAIVIGTGRIPIRASLVKSVAALFSIGSGGSIGREGPMVQMAAVLASLVGRWRKFSPPQQRLLVACGASAGIASAYNAPIAGSFFVAEIILGTIAMESLGPLVISAVVATLTIRVITAAHVLYKVPAFQLNSPLEMIPYVALGLIVGALAPVFLVSLKHAEKFFVSLKLPLVLRLALGGLVVGAIAINVPEVCGNGYQVIVEILNGRLIWTAILGIFACKWLATMASFGSGAPGGVFTPSLFMGAGAGLLFGTAVHQVWPAAAENPQAFALVGMGAFLSAASHAPVMAVIMLFEMTLSYDIILPLMLCCVIAYFTAKGVQGSSLYSEVLKRKAAAVPDPTLGEARVADMMRPNPPIVAPNARFAEIARMFLNVRVNNLYVVDETGRFIGAVSLHDIKPYLGEPDLAELVIARDILRDDFPHVAPDQLLPEALAAFLGIQAERVPVVEKDGTLRGSLSKSDLLLALVERQKRPAQAA
ncbi:ClcB-like voltage-gated chloride channel protein [Opitutus sp. ER46]|uniref:ClcB-like voltage-gated chloride channel protein n=1 Tax=Opitutus sp. ER46 TaxID=2161864 RepID=UPI000D30AC2E|nr:ClcB-like voltage-gated chloride channel protein [Opitutus sp. ER46]PTY01093.1 voltage-gated chloride channel ClcB [Opitutus sp. ER46]